MADVLGTGVSGLLAYQRALATTSHNITNANTDGYSRQRVEQATRRAQFEGFGYVGTGVQSLGVRRMYDEFVTFQYRTTTAAFNQEETLTGLAGRVDNFLADPQTGITLPLQEFFNGVQDVADDPTSVPARQALLGSADSLVTRFGNVYQRLEDLRVDVNRQVSDYVNEINNLANAIAKTNADIINSPKGSNDQQPNDLLDKRDQMIVELAKYINVTVAEQSDGALNVFIGNGQSLVVGINSQQIMSMDNRYNGDRTEVGYVSGGSTTNISAQLSGGKLGGALAFRSQILDPAFNQMGRIAIGLSASFNAQHRLGQDLDGDLGGDFFKTIDTSTPRVLNANSNTGTAVIGATVSDVNALTTSDYRLDYDGTTYTVRRMSDDTLTNVSALGFPGSTVTVDGIDISLTSGSLNAQDSFLIQPTRTGANDFRAAVSTINDIAAAAPIRTATGSSNAGTGSISAGVANDATNANLRQTVTISFTSPTTYNVSGTGTGNPTGLTYTSGSDISYNGWTVQIKGTPAAGDTFTVASNVGGVGDNRNALRLAALQTTTTMGNSTTTYKDAYGELVAQVGTVTRQAEVARDAQQVLKDRAESSRDQVAGVNLDEEAAQLVRYQQAYQAAVRIITTADEMFRALLGAVGR